MRYLISFLLSLWCFCMYASVQERIEVRNQTEFDSLSVSVRRALGRADSVEVKLSGGPFFFRENHLCLDDIDAPGKKVHIFGDVFVYPQMDTLWTVFNPGASLFPRYGDRFVPVSARPHIKKTRRFVRVVDRENKICRIRIDEILGHDAVDHGYIYLTQWYHGRVYKIVGVKGRDVYFLAGDLRQTRFLYSVNLDWTFSLSFPRYRIINGKSEYTAEDYAQANVTTFLSARGTVLGELKLSGLHFVGNSRPVSNEFIDASLLRFYGAGVKVSILSCSFEHIRSECIRISGQDSIYVENCRFLHCYRDCLYADPKTSYVSFVNNRLHDIGLCGDNVCAVACYARDFVIADNIMSDFVYSAIRTGIHYSMEKTAPLRGIISGNELYQTPSFYAAAPDELLMDSGVIYISTQNDDVLVYRNRIHDINGPTYNRGIFADDGASHVRVIENEVLRVKNYYCIDIDPRSAYKMRWLWKSHVNEAHVGVTVKGNMTDGRNRVGKSVMVD